VSPLFGPRIGGRDRLDVSEVSTPVRRLVCAAEQQRRESRHWDDDATGDPEARHLPAPNGFVRSGTSTPRDIPRVLVDRDRALLGVFTEDAVDNLEEHGAPVVGEGVGITRVRGPRFRLPLSVRLTMVGEIPASSASSSVR
jgi:hypothetical protein